MTMKLSLADHLQDGARAVDDTGSTSALADEPA